MQKFGALSSIIGTLVTSFIALLISVPVSFGVVICIRKLAPVRLRYFLRLCIDVLAGIPTIIYGMWGLFALRPFIGNTQSWLMDNLGAISFIRPLIDGSASGIGLLTASLVLSIIVLPFIASIIYDVFEVVPSIIEESSYALGASTWDTLWNVTIPSEKKAFTGAIMLGLGRSFGETMAVAFVIGNSHTLATNLFSPANSITSSIANEFAEAHNPLYTSSLIALGLCLFVLTVSSIYLSKQFLGASNKNQL